MTYIDYAVSGDANFSSPPLVMLCQNIDKVFVPLTRLTSVIGCAGLYSPGFLQVRGPRQILCDF